MVTPTMSIAAIPSATSTRDRLIDAAFRVVAREGLEAASVKVIAAEAGVTSGLVHYHFATKEAMLEAALHRGLEDYLARNRDRRLATPPHKQIEAFFAAAREAIQPDRDFFKVRLALAARAMTDPALASAMGAINRAAIEEVALVFAAARGETIAETSDLAIAATLKAAFDGIMLAWINDPQFPIDTAGDILEQATVTSAREPRLL
ncbi:MULTISPECIES: TetR/AcrR family transcriptional regulator [unclassified Sphingomonas]|uniref:TetR/AcrR family transcriptional regulator n=1 Tax=unclassified Sphingomonas TaxID=196159 RepID=UPI0035A9240E